MTGEKEIRCEICGGMGKISEAQDIIPGPVMPEPVTKACPGCNGTGYVIPPAMPA
jgi:DnaJ-class molecular chaperone